MELSDGAKAALSKVVESSATALADAMDSSGKMVKENVKELAHEIILFKGYIDHGIAATCAFVAMCILTCTIKWIYSGFADESRFIIMGGLSFGVFMMVCWFLDSMTTILKAKFAPRLFLTEYAIELMKKDSSTKK